MCCWKKSNDCNQNIFQMCSWENHITRIYGYLVLSGNVRQCTCVIIVWNSINNKFIDWCSRITYILFVILRLSLLYVFPPHFHIFFLSYLNKSTNVLGQLSNMTSHVFVNIWMQWRKALSTAFHREERHCMNSLQLYWWSYANIFVITKLQLRIY